MTTRREFIESGVGAGLVAVAMPAASAIAASQLNDGRGVHRALQRDLYRPIYHFVAPSGRAYPFDPNAAIYWRGRYHLFYIYQRSLAGKTVHVWGHIASRDLVHWVPYPDALTVGPADRE